MIFQMGRLLLSIYQYFKTLFCNNLADLTAMWSLGLRGAKGIMNIQEVWPVAYSAANRPLIPIEIGHLIR